MLKKLSNVLFSTRLTAFLFIAFAVAMITGTFLDAGQSTSPTPYSRNLIYNAWWFEGLHLGVITIQWWNDNRHRSTTINNDRLQTIDHLCGQMGHIDSWQHQRVTAGGLSQDAEATITSRTDSICRTLTMSVPRQGGERQTPTNMYPDDSTYVNPTSSSTDVSEGAWDAKCWEKATQQHTITKRAYI